VWAIPLHFVNTFALGRECGIGVPNPNTKSVADKKKTYEISRDNSFLIRLISNSFYFQFVALGTHQSRLSRGSLSRRRQISPPFCVAPRTPHTGPCLIRFISSSSTPAELQMNALYIWTYVYRRKSLDIHGESYVCQTFQQCAPNIRFCLSYDYRCSY